MCVRKWMCFFFFVFFFCQFKRHSWALKKLLDKTEVETNSTRHKWTPCSQRSRVLFHHISLFTTGVSRYFATKCKNLGNYSQNLLFSGNILIQLLPQTSGNRDLRECDPNITPTELTFGFSCHLLPNVRCALWLTDELCTQLPETFRHFITIRYPRISHGVLFTSVAWSFLQIHRSSCAEGAFEGHMHGCLEMSFSSSLLACISRFLAHLRSPSVLFLVVLDPFSDFPSVQIPLQPSTFLFSFSQIFFYLFTPLT